ncbi:unnamed protein product [Brassicogethes aeneus]|uniref:Nudix hydrolase domain-containing protein n=1 Tax=Brassicogethes aeneus TaxID=1431903 RepID=A0A9P0BMS3_BRAAE|nr:unnamed protein product [Brassicogethes aeneus]
MKMYPLPRATLLKSLGRRFCSLYAAENVLSDGNIKKTVQKFATMRPVKFKAPMPAKKAAVLIPVCEIDGKVSLLYTLRAASLRTHKGQVSFPGGRKDDTDETLEHTALRECYEELGINPNDILVWGSGNMLISRQETSVLPVVGQITKEIDPNKLKINKNEVDEVFTVPLEDLCDPKNLAHTQFKTGYTMPVFLGGKKRIWGLTGLITNIFLQSLLPPEAYTHNFKYFHRVLY